MNHENLETSAPIQNTSESDYRKEYLEILNTHRQKLGLKKLELLDEINEISSEHSLDMATGSVWFGHWGWKKRCSELKNFFFFNLCGEVVAKGQVSPSVVFEAWINSDSHRATLEENRYTHTGISYEEDSGGTKYWTQIFIERISDK